MHSVYFAVVPKDKAQNSEEARSYALEMLDGENFTGESGYFGGGKADWFVIGGRWSGLLSEANPKWKLIADRVQFLCKEYGIEHVRGVHYGDETKQANRDKISQEINAYAQEILGVPYDRDIYRQDGYEDDAQKLTPRLIAFLADWANPKEESAFWGEVEMFSQDDGEMSVTEETLNRYKGDWLVVIDYHN